MNFSKKEEKIIGSFYRYIITPKPKKELYLLKWKHGTEIYAKSDIIYETDNNLELDDSNYEDFVGIAILIKKIIRFNMDDNIFPDDSINHQNVCDWFKENHLYELNYHNFPDEIYNSKGELISKRED